MTRTHPNWLSSNRRPPSHAAEAVDDLKCKGRTMLQEGVEIGDFYRE